MRSTLAIDPGMSTGWAHYDPGTGKVGSGVRKFNERTHIKDADRKLGADLLDFHRWINTMIVRKKVDKLVTEFWINWEGKQKKKQIVDGKEVDVPIKSNPMTIARLYGFHNGLKMAAVSNGIEYENVAVQRWRNTFLSLAPVKAEFVKDGDFAKGKVKLGRDHWKKAVVAQCNSLGYEVKNSEHDRADAIGILEYFIHRDKDLFNV